MPSKKPQTETVGGNIRKKAEERTFLPLRAPLKQITALCNQEAEIIKLSGHHSNQKSDQSGQ